MLVSGVRISDYVSELELGARKANVRDSSLWSFRHRVSKFYLAFLNFTLLWGSGVRVSTPVIDRGQIWYCAADPQFRVKCKENGWQFSKGKVGESRGEAGQMSQTIPVHMTVHLARSMSRRSCDRDLAASGCREMLRRLSSCSSSWNNSFTLWSVLADVSMNAHFHCFDSAAP